MNSVSCEDGEVDAQAGSFELIEVQFCKHNGYMFLISKCTVLA